jgi:hypothetical protein
MPATDDATGSAEPIGHPQSIETRLGTLQYELGCPTPETTRTPAVV